VLRLTGFPKKEIRPQEHGTRGIYLEWRSHSPCFFGEITSYGSDRVEDGPQSGTGGQPGNSLTDVLPM